MYNIEDAFPAEIASWTEGKYLNWEEVKAHYPLWLENNKAELDAKGL